MNDNDIYSFSFSKTQYVCVQFHLREIWNSNFHFLVYIITSDHCLIESPSRMNTQNLQLHTIYSLSHSPFLHLSPILEWLKGYGYSSLWGWTFQMKQLNPLPPTLVSLFTSLVFLSCLLFSIYRTILLKYFFFF